MPLTLHQRMALPVVEWLLYDEYPSVDRGTGRTTVMVYVFMRKAVANPGRPVFPYDHIHPQAHFRSWDYLRHVITQLAKTELEFEDYDFQINESKQSLSARKRPNASTNSADAAAEQKLPDRSTDRTIGD